ncbi:MAG TPA: aminoglycoside phosphotransferase family protein [Candidatus Polarisedimenticolia bacterium]|nr:aminoglycoside phosphotransferase family protein [Candidatus Polarisedimenticolia bacterium]
MIGATSESFRSFAAEGLGVAPRDLTVMMIHRPHEDKNYVDQSIYFYFLPQQRYPAVVGKVGFDRDGARYLEREHRGLQALVSRGPAIPIESVPRPILYREISGNYLLLQSALKGDKIATWITPRARLNGRVTRLLQWAPRFSAALGNATRCDGGALVPVWTEEFSVKLDRTGRSRTLLETAARNVWEAFGKTFPAVLAHGDFCGENILEDGPRHGVIDWELCDELSLPAYDLLDLCLWLSFRTEGSGRWDPFNALDRVLNGRDFLAQEMRKALGEYAREMRFPARILPEVLALAWAGYCLKKFRYLQQDETGSFARARAGVRKILDTPPEFLSGEGGTA